MLTTNTCISHIQMPRTVNNTLATLLLMVILVSNIHLVWKGLVAEWWRMILDWLQFSTYISGLLSIRGGEARCSSVVRAFPHGAMGCQIDSLNYFLFQPVLHDWCNKGQGMCYPVCGMVHIKEPLLLIGKSSPCGGSRFLLLLSQWFFTICLMPYNHNKMCWVCH